MNAMPDPDALSEVEHLVGEMIVCFSEKRAVAWLQAKFSAFDTSYATSLVCNATCNEREYFSSSKLLGVVANLPISTGDKGCRSIPVVAVRMRHGLKGWTGRLVQRFYAGRLLRGEIMRGKTNADEWPSQCLMFFYDGKGRFRLSFVSRSGEEGTSICRGTSFQSFWVERGASNRIFKRRWAMDVSSLADLESVFSFERLRQEFCSRVIDWYKKTLCDTDVFRGDKNIGNSRELGEEFVPQVMRLLAERFVALCPIVPKSLIEQVDGIAPDKHDGRMAGLGELLDQYDFSIEENTTNDTDLILDPEIIGTVFENLLDVATEDVKESVRNATGSFYTSREIVDYMGEEALRHYLLASGPGREDESWRRKLDDLFDVDKYAEGSETLFSPDERQSVVDALANCRILDPACGAGAFPIGIMNCLVRLLARLDFGHSDYARKKRIAERCLWGVDIQRIPVQLSKLRLAFALANELHRTQKARASGISQSSGFCSAFVCANTLTEEIFGERNDFDIVIGNPPYFVIRKNTPCRDEYVRRYAYLQCRRMNIYQLFMGRCSTMLSEFGCMSFIHPKTLLCDSFLRATRDYLLKTFQSVQIVSITARHNTFKSVSQSVILTQWSRLPFACRIGEIRHKKDLKHASLRVVNRGDFVLPSGKLLVSEEPLASRIISKVESVKRRSLGFVSGTIEWNQYKACLSHHDETHDIRLLFGENVRRYGRAESKKREDRSFLSLHTLPILKSPAIVCQRISSPDKPWRIIATIVDPNEEPFPIVTENHVNVLELGRVDECRYVLGVLNSSVMDYYFRLVNSNTQVSSGGLNELPIPVGDTLTRQMISVRVGEILSRKKVDDEAVTDELQKDLDNLVFRLYDLSKEEIAIVERRRADALRRETFREDVK